jgi:hypothetical protein
MGQEGQMVMFKGCVSVAIIMKKTDEVFLVWRGEMTIASFASGGVTLRAGELCVGSSGEGEREHRTHGGRRGGSAGL